MNYKLSTKLSLSYVLITLLCVGLISIFTNVLLEKQFREYIIEKQENQKNEIISLLSGQYYNDGKWNADAVSTIGINALENGYILKVKDTSGEIIWDATIHNNGFCNQMLAHMAENMNSRYRDWNGKYVENQFPIISNNMRVGTADIGFYGPFSFSDSDLQFINTLNKFLIGVAIFSLLLSFILGAIMGRRISKPISRVIESAQKISNGYLQDRINEKSNTKEINQLTISINNLADTLENQEKLRKRLTSDVAHELRTPLATLQSHMEAMIDGIWEASPDRLKSCQEEIIRINNMIVDLEKLAKIESENITLVTSDFNIYEVVNNTIRNFENEFSKKNIQIDIKGEDININADRDKITQVIVNLLSNALKYTESGDTVKVTLTREDNNVKLSVKDTGIGISEEDLPNIFERFYRADKSRNRLTGGSGIGLTITKAIVEAHMGKIEVRSKLGEGSEFVVILPKVIG